MSPLIDHAAFDLGSDDPVGRWRADRSECVDEATQELVKQAFDADPRILAFRVEMDHSSGAAWVKVEVAGCAELVDLEDTPDWPAGVPVLDLACIAYDLGDQAQEETPLVFRRAV
jgi:hypothetical protein